jgi:hypothetical protein
VNGGNGKFYYDVAKDCSSGTCKVYPQQQRCTLMQMLTNNEEVQQNWLDMDAGSSGGIRVACASDAIDVSPLFRGRKKQASIDVEVLRRIIEQDAPTVIRQSAKTSPSKDTPAPIEYCSVVQNGTREEGIMQLNTLVQRKALIGTGVKKICVKPSEMRERYYPVSEVTNSFNSQPDCEAARGGDNRLECVPAGTGTMWIKQLKGGSRVSTTTSPGGYGSNDCQKLRWFNGACFCERADGKQGAQQIDIASEDRCW